MLSAKEAVERNDSVEKLSVRFERVRLFSLALCRSLKTEDYVVQSMPDVSPTKWHLAHITWFFEKFVLKPYAAEYRNFDDRFHYLFNSYYYSAGNMHRRPERGLLSRPTVDTVVRYRAHVDDAVLALLDQQDLDPAIEQVVILGLNHEQQHQELLLTDIKHVFSRNPMMPAVNPDLIVAPAGDVIAHQFISGTSGIHEIGATGDGFSFDNETPRHRVLLDDHKLGSRLITNGEYLEFITDGGYQKTDLWLSDGWATVCEQQWDRPLYWSEDHSSEFTMRGETTLNSHAPVTHVSYYEADAFARWAGARLPTESEWEVAASRQPVDGNLVESEYWQPTPADQGKPQFFGDVWEWTSSPYASYPGFRPLAGSLGEYNGKFMCNQMTVRGGSCVSSTDHLRASYRSFFYPDARWQYLGIRLAKDGTT